MRFIVDECTGSAVAKWLAVQGHDVFSVFDEARGIDDDEVLKRALDEARILITNDKDFGEKVYREDILHHGIIFLRLTNERYRNKIEVLEKLLHNYPDRLEGKFVVVTEDRVRFASR